MNMERQYKHRWGYRMIGEQGATAIRKPLVELLEDRRLLIENHGGVAAYGEQEICVKVCFGVISVCGSGLKLIEITKDRLVIIGCIRAVLIKREER